MTRIAVVTGGNKGIGYAIVKGLYQQFDGIIYSTARNENLGKSSVEQIKADIPAASKRCQDLLFHQLDISDQQSIQRMKDFIVQQHGGLDILINNAGIAYKNAAKEPFGEQAENTIATNYTGKKHVCDAFFPILKPHARVVNLSSSAGLFRGITDGNIKKKFISSDLTVADIDGILNDFIKYAKEGTHAKHGFPNSAYAVSKIGVTALSFVQQRMFDKDNREDIIVNACDPGYVKTDMSSHMGPLSPDEGAVTPLYLALLPNGVREPKGRFVKEKRVADPTSGEYI